MSAPFQPGDVVEAVGAPRDQYPGYQYAASKPAGRKVCRVLSCVGPYRLGVWGVTVTGIPGFWGHVCFRKIDDEVTDDFRQRLKSLPKQRERIGLNPARHDAYKRERVL